jgi:glycosyltransferase involved in cell wall biosynthesis
MATSGTRPRRISFVTTGLGVGGAEAMLFRVVTHLDRARFEPAIVSVMDDGEYGPRFRAEGIPVTSIGFTNRVPTPQRLVRLVRTLQRQRPDAIMGWMYHGNLAASLGRAWASPHAGLAWNIRHSVYDLADEGLVTRNLIRLGALLSGRVDATVYVSDVSRRLHLQLGYAPEPAVVIGNGIDPTPLISPKDRAALRRELGFDASDVVVGRVARFHPMKDFPGFLEAVTGAIEVNPLIKVLLVGREVGPENPVLAPLLASPGLAGRVVWLGERQDVPRLLGAMDILASSSAWGEGFPNIVLEAAMAGLPCVVTDVGASGEIAGEGGRVVPPRDVGALRAAIVDVSALEPARRLEMGAVAREHALANYTLATVVDRYAELFDRLSGPASERRRTLPLPV